VSALRGKRRIAVPKREREPVAAATIKTPLGKIWVLATEAGLRQIRLSDTEAPTRPEMDARGWKLVRKGKWTDPARRLLERYLEGRERRLEIALDLALGTQFQRRVWEAARRIPYGAVVSYAELASMAGGTGAFRAVGNALGANPVPIVVPCHRIIHADQSIGGFSSGLRWKRHLLTIERGQLELNWKPRRSLFAR
jgi:methylated-DNA-[protein]-cysteine S-methyltransferase